MRLKKYIAQSLGFLLFTLNLTAKVLLITHSYNRPDFIELHVKTFKHFLKDEYEYVVFNDASNQGMKQQIEDTCKKLNIRHFRIPQEIHHRPSPGHRHMDGIQYAFDQIGYDFDGIVALVDSDLFLLKPFSIEKYLEGYDIAGELQNRKNGKIIVNYLSPALAFMDMRKLPNKRTLSFEGGYVEGLACDVGAHTYYYFNNNPSVKPKYINVIHIGAMKIVSNCAHCSNGSCPTCIELLIKHKFTDRYIKFIQNVDDNIEFFLDHSFLHYRSGSNWNNQSSAYHNAKTLALNNFITDMMYEYYYYLHAVNAAY
jgi:hypothetical protein